MATNKDHALVQFLLSRTQGGEVHWEPTAVEMQFTTSFKGKYNVLLDTTTRGERFWLTLKDTSDRELLSIADDEVSDVRVLFHAAQRESLNVDRAIDEILTSEGSSKEGSSKGSPPISDDDIPF